MAAVETTEQKPNAGFAALWRFLPMLWPKGEAELKARVVVAVAARARRARPSTLLGPYALKLAVDRMSAHAAFAVVAGLVVAYAGGALRRRAVRQSAQRDFREGRPGRRAAARRPGLPPRPRSVAALPPRAAHRIADQDRRARHQEHRHDALFPAVQHRPDGDRADRDLRHLLRQVRRRAGRRDAGDRRHLHRLHAQGHRLAHAHPARR